LHNKNLVTGIKKKKSYNQCHN